MSLLYVLYTHNDKYSLENGRNNEHGIEDRLF